MKYFFRCFTSLLAMPDFLGRIAKRQNRKYIQCVRDIEQFVDFRHGYKTNPIGANTVCPRGEDHGLDGAAAIGEGDFALLDDHHDGECCLRYIGAGLGDRT